MAHDRRGESPAAALARLRWAGTTPEERADHARMMVRAREAGRAARRGENRPPQTPADPEKP